VKFSNAGEKKRKIEQNWLVLKIKIGFCFEDQNAVAQ